MVLNHEPNLETSDIKSVFYRVRNTRSQMPPFPLTSCVLLGTTLSKCHQKDNITYLLSLHNCYYATWEVILMNDSHCI